MYILLIDDDVDDASFFFEAAAALDRPVRVEHVASGREAIDMLGADYVQIPDLIFMDVNMPVMDGWSTARELKRILSDRSLPVVMFSSMNFKNVGFGPADVGAIAFMTKPDSMEGLKTGLRQLLSSLAL